MSDRRLCPKCRPMFEESYLASARHVLKDGAVLVKEQALIEAAEAMIAADEAASEVPRGKPDYRNTIYVDAKERLRLRVRSLQEARDET